MKRMNGAWLAYCLVFLVFEIVLTRYILVFDRLDQMRIVNNWHSGTLDYLFKVLTFLGELLVPVCLVIYFIFKKRAWIKPFLFSYAVSTLVIQGLKHFVFASALRPYAYFKAMNISWYLVPGVEIHEHNSFPSGHTAAAWFCFVWIALVINTRWAGILCALFACGVGISRVYLFQHFPVDVAFGALIGISSSSVFYFLYHENIAK